MWGAGSLVFVKARITRASAIAAAVLALGTLGVFIRLQEYGPESAIRKFHQALQRGSLPALQRVTEEDVNAPGVQLLAIRVAAYLRAGGNRFRILRTDRTPTEVRAAVAYTAPGGPPQYMVWVVNRQGRTWKVSARKTAQVMASY